MNMPIKHERWLLGILNISRNGRREVNKSIYRTVRKDNT